MDHSKLIQNNPIVTTAVVIFTLIIAFISTFFIVLLAISLKNKNMKHELPLTTTLNTTTRPGIVKIQGLYDMELIGVRNASKYRADKEIKRQEKPGLEKKLGEIKIQLLEKQKEEQNLPADDSQQTDIKRKVLEKEIEVLNTKEESLIKKLENIEIIINKEEEPLEPPPYTTKKGDVITTSVIAT